MSNEEIVLKPAGPVEAIPAPASETVAVLNMIERAARDPSVDVDKLRQLMEMREKAEMRQAERAFSDAMSAAQSKMTRVRADATNSQTRSKYATYAALDRALRPIYTEHGLSLSFNTEESGVPELVRVICYVEGHGHTRKYSVNMPADGKGAKGGDVMTKTHATGSAISYGMRYLLKMIFNIAVGDDDDGNAAGGDIKRITQKQADDLIDLLEASGKDRGQFLRWARVDRIEDIPADYYDSCVQAIKAPKASK